MKITPENYTEFYTKNRQLVIFAETGITRLAHDSWDQDHIDYTEAFATIFDDLWDVMSQSYIHPEFLFILGDPEMIKAMKLFCEEGLEMTVKDIREAEEDFDDLPVNLLLNLHPAQRN
jgi:hypothetical protein